MHIYCYENNSKQLRYQAKDIYPIELLKCENKTTQTDKIILYTFILYILYTFYTIKTADNLVNEGYCLRLCNTCSCIRSGIAHPVI